MYVLQYKMKNENHKNNRINNKNFHIIREFICISDRRTGQP